MPPHTDASGNDSNENHNSPPSPNSNSNSNSPPSSNSNSNSPPSPNSNSNSHTDASDNVVYVTIVDASGNHSVITSYDTDASGNVDCSGVDLSFNIPNIVTYSLNQTITETGLQIKNKQGVDASGEDITYTTFTTTHLELYVPQIQENLLQTVETYNDELDPTSQTSILISEIKDYASKIKCSDFHGKGTIEDYSALFEAASQIANETKQITLDIDVEGFDEFSQAADELSALFTSFIMKLQNVNIINDITFLTSISVALRKIWNLSEVFGRFKETILATTTIQMPKSAHDAKTEIVKVMSEVNCAMQYINYFVSPTAVVPLDAALTSTEKHIIDKAVDTIHSWNTLCEHGVTISMENNPDVQYIKQASNQLKNTTLTLKNATSNLRTKFARYNIC